MASDEDGGVYASTRDDVLDIYRSGVETRVRKSAPKPAPRKSKQKDNYAFIPSSNSNQSLQGTFNANERLNRSLSYPEDLKHHHMSVEVNKAIHAEIMSTPWGTLGRRSDRRRNRYEDYLSSESEPFRDLEPYYDNECFRDESNVPTSRDFELQGYGGNVYGTFRRAPRTYPRLDAINVHNQIHRNDTNESRILSQATPFDRVFPKIPNREVNNREKYLDVTLCHDKRQSEVNDQTAINHMFSIQLTDVQNVNSTLSSPTSSDTMEEVNNSCTRIKRTLSTVCQQNNSVDSEKSNVCFCGVTNKLRKLCCAKSSSCRRKTNGSKKNGTHLSGGSEKPFFYCRWVTDYPKSMFFLTLGGHILIALVTGILLWTGYDLFPTEFETLPMYDWEVPWMRRSLAWNFRHEYENRYVRKWFIQGFDKWYRSMAYDRANIVLYYDTGGGNIFTKTNLKAIETIEHEMSNMANYSQFCVQNATFNCHKPTSVLRYFDGTYKSVNPVFFDPKYNNIAQVLYAAMTNNQTKGDFAYFLSSDHELTPKGVHAPVTRTIMPLGFPLKLKQKIDEMEDEMEHFLINSFKPTIHDVREATSGFRITYWSYLLFRHDIVRQIFYDMMLAGGSVIFIFGFIVYHTKSLWISSFAVMSILTSFLCTNLIYRIALDFRYIGYFHVITLFIILGIGADDIFVFLDVWKNTGYQEHSSLSMRLTTAYKQSIKSMFFTSLTTAVAFLTSSFSPLLATQSFGLFAGVLVIVNYVSVVVYFPTVLIMHHYYFKDKSWPCFSKKFKRCLFKSCQTEEEESDKIKLPTPTPHNVDPIQNISSLFEDNSAVASNGRRYNVVGRINSAFKTDEDEYGFMRFKNCSQPHSDFQLENETEVKSVYAELSECSDHTSPATSTSGIEKQQRKALVRFFRDHYFRFVTHFIAKWIILIVLLSLVGFFAYSITKLKLDNEQRDMSTCHFSESRCIGEESMDSSFNPNTQEAQIALKNFCDKIHNFSDSEIDHFKVRRDFTTKEPEITCFARDLDQFLRIPISYWLNDRYTFKNKTTFDRYQSLIGEGVSPYSTPMKTDFSVFYGNRIVYLGIQVNLTLGRFSSGYVEGKPVMERWEAFVKEEMKNMPPGLQNGFQLTKDYWHSLSVQKTISDNAIFGIVLGIVLALPILTVATQNIVIGVCATFSMCCSTICVIGIIPLIGWKLGILESLNMCMVVGLTVDYVVHLAEGYHTSQKADRKSRVQDMLEVMGISVFSGACTTLGASVFMFFAQIQFIVRFGIFLFCTIGFSLLFSLGLFSTIMGIMGPSGNTGDIKMFYRKVKETFRKCCC
ncbi:DISP1-like protein [Mya arenaria]|uniref:DISP1-like protein n=1 Tax=Mya arenaria TaxID=6604 RepID=A0ABY7FE37_MYAAR|nr:DISP1-like protein [Mya arenaria]